MAQDARSRWNRTDGVVIAPAQDPDALAAALRERGVVARMEWYPATPHLLGLTLLTDAEGRVAVTPPSRGGVVPGTRVSELTEGLAQTLAAAVSIGPASFDALGDQELPEPAEAGGAERRTVVVSPLSAYTVPLQAALLDRALAVASVPGVDRRVIMYTGEGADLGAFGWDEDALPAVILTADAEDLSVRAVTTVEDLEEDEAIYSWSMTSRYVWGGVDEPGPALRGLADELLADSTDAGLLAQAVPGADADAVADALGLSGAEGMVAMVGALGLPEWVGRVLTGRLAPAEVPGVVVHEPRGLSNAVGRSLGMALEDPDVPGSGLWRSYVTAVTDMPWLVRAGALAQATLGGVLIGRAVRRRRVAGRLSAGLLAGGVLLLTDAVVEASVASLARRKELRRRADEETALVAEELGA